MKKVITIILLVGFLVFGIWFYWKYYYTYSEGNRTGLLQKFSHRGNLFKTYEGELVLHSLVTHGESPISAEKFYFSVDDKKLAQEMMGYEGKKVVLHYEEKNGALFWRGDSRYMVDSIRLVE